MEKLLLELTEVIKELICQLESFRVSIPSVGDSLRKAMPQLPPPSEMLGDGTQVSPNYDSSQPSGGIVRGVSVTIPPVANTFHLVIPSNPSRQLLVMGLRYGDNVYLWPSTDLSMTPANRLETWYLLNTTVNDATVLTGPLAKGPWYGWLNLPQSGQGAIVWYLEA